MAEKEKIEKEIKLTFDHLREIIDNPALADEIPNGAAVVFLEKDEPIPEMKTTPTGEPIKYIRVKKQFESLPA